MKKIVLAYSGGLDTSIIIPWLKENYGYEVIAMAADLGQGEELEPLHEKALQSGASKLYIEDVKREFVTDYIYPTLKAGAIYEGKYLLGTSMARPLIAKKLVEIAAKEGAEAVAHGATGKGNDQVRFELTVKALNPGLKIVAPWREWDIRSRDDAIDYAEARGIPVPVTKSRPYSMDRNIWHLSHEGGSLEDPGLEPPEDVLLLTVAPEKAPDKPTYVEIEFHRGVPKKVNGREPAPEVLGEELNVLGGANGIGVVDMVENRYVGMKSRGVYETPGGTVIHVARRALESITLDREVMHLKDEWIPRYANLVYNGYWFSPEREMLQAGIDEAAKSVSGEVRLKLYKGNATVTGRKSDESLYDDRFSTFEEDEVYTQSDADGFIRINALRLRIRSMKRDDCKF